jgi:2-hydroxy-6-oxonona-2,4-dienedioate hydrolase/2-hydroxy-6-oxo-6-(2'-carboxyphenyl)-hexa-2,4-dienoate hydrolase
MTMTLAIKPPAAKPLSEWETVAVELLGTQTRIVQGKQFYHRVIECGTQGEPLILIHGIGGHAETYARSLHNLANNGFHVYAIDALYHGFSSKGPRVDNRTEMQADALADLIEALGYGWAHVEGESMGGSIAFVFGMKYPQMSGKLILNTGVGPLQLKRTEFPENPGGGTTLQELSQRSILEPTFENVRARMEWLVAEPSRMTDEMVRIRMRLYSFPEVYDSIKWIYRMGQQWSAAATQQRTYTEEEIQEFKPQSLVFWTEKNPGQGPAFGEYVSNVIPGAKFYNMLDAAHWPQWEKPEEHDQVLIDFIKGK